jgi:diguanylate cyclase (GGDEF)-like protein
LAEILATKFTRPRPFSFYLIALCAALLLPVMAIAGFMTWRFAESEEMRLENHVNDINRGIVIDLERQDSADIAMIRTLATTPSLRDGDLASFAVQAKSLVASSMQDGRIILVSPDSERIIFDSGAGSDPGNISASLQHNQFGISDIQRGKDFSNSAYLVTVPVTFDGKVKYYLVGRMPLSRMARILREQNLTTSYFASIVDRNGIILARSAENEKFFGQKLPGLDGKHAALFTWSGINPQGVPVYGIFRTLKSGWGVSTGISQQVLHAPLRNSLIYLAVIALVMIAISVAVAWSLAAILARATQSLVRTANTLGHVQDVATPVTAVAEANTIGTAMMEASKRLRQQAEALSEAKSDLERRVEQRTMELAEKANLLQATLANMDQGLVVIDKNGFIQLHNARAAELVEIPETLFASHPHVTDTINYQKNRGDFQNPPDDVKVMLAPENLVPGQTLVHEREKPGDRVMEIRTVPLNDGGMVRTYTDVTLRKHAERHLQHLARHDPLTELPNRVYFGERLEQAIAYSQRHDLPFSLLYLDLDHFKYINDLHGHAVGDALLIEVASRLKSALRMEDTVARFGGDEFAVIQTGDTEYGGSIELARRLLRVVAKPYGIDGNFFEMGVSIGIAMSPEHGNDAKELMKAADTALYQAKRSGRSRFCVFEAPAKIRRVG